MALELTKSTGKPVKIYGKDYMLGALTVKESDEFQEAIEAAGTEKERAQVGKELIAKKGIPMAVLQDMELEHFIQLIEYMAPKKA